MKAKTIFSAACKILTFVVATIDVFELGKTYYNKKKAQPTNPVGRAYGRQPKTVAKRYIIDPKVSTFAL